MEILRKQKYIINNYVLLEITCTNQYQIIKILKYKKINIYKIYSKNNNTYIKIKYKDIPKISKLYKYKAIKYYGPISIIKYIKNNKTQLIYLLSILLLIIIYSLLIIDIDIKSNNNHYIDIITKELKTNNIIKYSIRKPMNKIDIIKEQILNNNKDIEWINIERVGMKYIINIEPRIIKEPTKENINCNIIAKKDGTITKIISSKGIELVEKNDVVKKGDILISGSIMFNDEVKSTVCATGYVYAKTWYTINIKTRKYYEKNTYTGKKRYNIIINDKKLLKEKYMNHKDTNKKIINILNNKIYISKELEYNKNYIKYDEQTLNKNISKLINEKLSIELKNDYKIIEQKVLKKIENNSTIELEYFIVAEELISTQQILEQEVIT